MCMFRNGSEPSSYLSRNSLGIIWVSYRFEMERVQQLLRELMLWPVLICVAHYFCDILWTMNNCNKKPWKVPTFSFPVLLLLPLGNCSLSSTYALMLCEVVYQIDFSLFAAFASKWHSRTVTCNEILWAVVYLGNSLNRTAGALFQIKDMLDSTLIKSYRDKNVF